MTLKKFELCMSISFISLYVYVNVKGVTYALEGELHPALLLHWRVQAYLVGYLDPDSRREVAAGAPDQWTATPRLHHEPGAVSPGPESRGGGVDLRGTIGSPPKETVKEEDTPPAAARELAPEPEGSQAPPTEDQEGPTHPQDLSAGR